MGNRKYWAAGVNSGGNLLYTSTDRGATWIAANLPNGLAPQSRLKIAPSKNFYNTLYLLCPDAEKIYKTTNGGGTWSDVTAGFPNGTASDPDYNWSQSTYYDSVIETGTNGDNDIVYVGLIDAVRSGDGGATWSRIGLSYNANAIIHNDQHAIAVFPSNSELVSWGNDGGSYVYTRDSNGNSFWFNLNNHLGLTEFVTAAHHPTDLENMIGGTQDNACPQASGNVASWGCAPGGDGGGCAIAPDSPNIQYSSAQRFSQDANGNCRIFQTVTGWAGTLTYNFNGGTDTWPKVGQMCLDPNNSNLLFFGSNKLWFFAFSGVPGVAIIGRVNTTDLTNGGGTISAIAVAPSDSSRIYVGTSNGLVQRTKDGGATWSNITTNLPAAAITDLSVNPNDKDDLLVSVSGVGTGHIWHCFHAGAISPNWTDASGSGLLGLPDIPANTVTRSIYDPTSTWWVGNDLGAFLTPSQGGAWLNINPLGLPNVEVNDLSWGASSHLFAATYGRGMWNIEIFPPNTTITTFSSPNLNPIAPQTLQALLVLDHPAPDSGTKVSLQSNQLCAVPPGSVDVPFNADRINVPIQLWPLNLQPQPVTITAVMGSFTKNLTLTVQPPANLFGPSQLQVIEGSLFTGSVSNLAATDNSNASFFDDTDTLSTTIELRGSCPVGAANSMSLFWCSHVSRAGLVETISLRDFQANTFEDEGSREGTLANSAEQVSGITNGGRFIGPNRLVRARLNWTPINDEVPSQDGWLQYLDYFAWLPG